MAHRVGEVAGLHLVLLLDDRSPRLAVRNLLRRRLDCELGILEQPGKSGRAHVEVVGALAARVDEGEVVRVIVGVAVLVHIVVLLVLPSQATLQEGNRSLSRPCQYPTNL